METPAYRQKDHEPSETYEPTHVTLDYLQLKECMKAAIKEALRYERQRRERAIGLYVLFMFIFGAMLVVSSTGSFYDYRIIEKMATVRMTSLVGLGATQVIFSIWALTRWF